MTLLSYPGRIFLLEMVYLYFVIENLFFESKRFFEGNPSSLGTFKLKAPNSGTCATMNETVETKK